MTTATRTSYQRATDEMRAWLFPKRFGRKCGCGSPITRARATSCEPCLAARQDARRQAMNDRRQIARQIVADERTAEVESIAQRIYDAAKGTDRGEAFSVSGWATATETSHHKTNEAVILLKSLDMWHWRGGNSDQSCNENMVDDTDNWRSAAAAIRAETLVITVEERPSLVRLQRAAYREEVRRLRKAWRKGSGAMLAVVYGVRPTEVTAQPTPLLPPTDCPTASAYPSISADVEHADGVPS